MKVSIATAFVLFAYFAVNSAFKLQPKIVNGYRAEVGQFPFFTFLQIQHIEANKQLACGGTLISDKFILTAAHCLVEARSLVAHFGKSQLDHVESSHVKISVSASNFHIHSDVVLSQTVVRNDIGALNRSNFIIFNLL